MDFRKTYFLIPNLFTLASVFCGFYAVALCAKIGEAGAHDSELLYKAALAIIIGGFLDASDGRIARLTKTQSDLGLQLDSLADVVTFGVAPALLIYRWGLEDLPRFGLTISFLFLACGTLRLARFNVLTMREKHGAPNKKSGKYTLGLPIPIAACTLVGLVLATRTIGVAREATMGVAGLVLVLSVLMISKVRFRSMKDLQLNRGTITFAGILMISAVWIATRFNRPAVLVFLIVCYIALGLAEELRFFHLGRVAAKNARLQALAITDAEVLAELGADEFVGDLSMESGSEVLAPPQAG